jgi:type IV pilus assembly protein PilA
MKNELKAKFLQHLLSKKKEDEGFTLIELLVVIIIIGILAAIALPSFLNQASKAKQSEAKTYVGSINRAQQSYRIQNTSFAATFDNLQIGIPTQTTNYTYSLSAANSTSTQVSAASRDANALKSYAGGVVIRTSGQTATAACETSGVTATPPTITLAAAADPTCPTGSVPMD